MKRIVFAVLLVSCGPAGPEKITAPNGGTGFALTCQRSRENCLTQAGEQCGREGYYVVSESSHAGGILADALPGPVTWYNIQVACGEPEAGYRPPRQAQPVVYNPEPAKATVRCRKEFSGDVVCKEE